MEPQECETEADADADAAEGRARGMGRRTDGSLAAKGEPYLRRGIPAHQASGGSANTKEGWINDRWKRRHLCTAQQQTKIVHSAETVSLNEIPLPCCM